MPSRDVEPEGRAVFPGLSFLKTTLMHDLKSDSDRRFDDWPRPAL
jgi:hypothetical protein